MKSEMQQDASMPQESKATPVALRRWVMWSTDESIAQRQISLLALAEIPLAMALFWEIARLSAWPWLTLIGLMAAPVLLLRSPASIAAGVAALGAYAERDTDLSRHERWTLLVFAVACTGTVVYWLAQSFLPGQIGWALFSRSAAIGALAVVAVVMVAITGVAVIAGTGTGAVAFADVVSLSVALACVAAGAVAGVVSGVVAGVGAGVGAVTGVGVGVVAVAFMRTSKGGRVIEAVSEGTLWLLASACFILGLFLRGTFIRLWTTLAYLYDGLLAFSNNWVENICVVDFRHLPALLPGAGEIDPQLTLKGLLARVPEGRLGERLYDHMVILVLVPLIYIPALLYRWNIKASAMIWGPVAWALRPSSWLDDEDMRTRTSIGTTWGLLGFVGPGIVGYCAWLLLPFAETNWVRELPAWLQYVSAQWPAPVYTSRYLMLWLCWACLATLWWNAYRIRAAHAKALEGAGDYKNYDDALKSRLRIMADAVRVRLQWTTAVAALTIWTFALKWALDRWPNELQHIAWEWIRPWL